MKKKSSEFGKGYSYCLGLFLMHAERYWGNKKKELIQAIPEKQLYGLWFNGAADHLCEFQPYNKRGRIFKDTCVILRLGDATEKDYQWAIDEAKELLILWDKKNGVDVIKGSWE